MNLKAIFDIEALFAALRAARIDLQKQRKAQEAAAEKAAIARLFNDRYCYRHLYVADAPQLTGSALHGLLPRGGNRWMCPDCNRIHAPDSCSMWSGLQYPACCTHGEGHRLDSKIRMP